MAAPKILKVLDYFFVLRPVLFVPGWSTLLAGYLISTKKELFFSSSEFTAFEWQNIFYILTLFAVAMGAAFLQNQLKDIETDITNKKLFFLSENHIPKKAAFIEIILLLFCALLMAYFVNMRVFWHVAAFMIVTGYLYNYKPFSLKDRPWGSVLANAMMGWLAFAIGWHSFSDNPGNIIYDSFPYLFFNTALYFFTTLPDVPGDRDINKRTLAVIKGEKFVIYSASICYLLSLGSAIYFSDNYSLLFIIPSAPFFIMAFIKKKIKYTIIATKYGIAFFAAVICLKLPLYICILAIIFIFTKWFFSIRFQYNYPNFKGA